MKKVGELVKIKENADEIRKDHWRDSCVTEYMCRTYAGKTLSIHAVDTHHGEIVYCIDSWWWEEYYLESIGNFNCNSLI